MSDIDEFYNTNKTMLMLWSYNKSLDNIVFPDSLEQIFFGNIFNQSIDNIKFPINLKIIVLSDKFNRPLHNVKFPDGLECIDLGDEFNQSLDNITFPHTLQLITLGSNFNLPITNLPLFLKELRLTKAHQLKKIKIPIGCVVYDNIKNIIIKE